MSEAETTVSRADPAGVCAVAGPGAPPGRPLPLLTWSGGWPPRAVPQHLTSRDAAALLGVPESHVRRLVRDGVLAGFRAEGYWIVRGDSVARYHDSERGALARLRTDYPDWRMGALSSGYFVMPAAVNTRRRRW